MRLKNNRSSRRIALFIGLSGMLLIAACERPTTETADYKVQHKISAEEKVFTLDLGISDRDRPFEARDVDTVRRFAREYLRRGRGPFLIAADGTDTSSSQSTFNRMAAVVVEAGVPAHRVYFQVRKDGKAGPGPTRLSFAGYVVRLPDCGDWSGETGFAPSNQPHSDFGCSYQRNFGLMLANPGDLKISVENVEGAATRTDYVVKTYRAGDKAIGRGKPPLEQGQFSDVR